MCPRLRGPELYGLYAPGTVRFFFWAKKCPKVEQAPRGVLRESGPNRPKDESFPLALVQLPNEASITQLSCQLVVSPPYPLLFGNLRLLE